MKQASRIVALISALTGSAMFGSEEILPLFHIKGLPPSFAQYWPIAAFFAVIVHQVCGIVATWLRDQQSDSQPGDTSDTSQQKVSANQASKLVPAFALIIASAFLFSVTGCAFLQTEQTKVQAQIQQGLQYAQSPQGQQLLATVGNVVNVIAANGGMKSKANAANISTALRALEGGSLPSVSTLTNSIALYTGGSNSTASQLAGSILQVVQAAPTPTAGLEAAASKLDAISAAAAPKTTFIQQVKVYALRPFLHFRNSSGVALR